LDDLREWRERGIAFTVRDAETGEDVSRVLLA
jgi:polyhydroxyalkanoate synthesis regulator protein